MVLACEPVFWQYRVDGGTSTALSAHLKNFRGCQSQAILFHLLNPLQPKVWRFLLFLVGTFSTYVEQHRPSNLMPMGDAIEDISNNTIMTDYRMYLANINTNNSIRFRLNRFTHIVNKM